MVSHSSCRANFSPYKHFDSFSPVKTKQSDLEHMREHSWLYQKGQLVFLYKRSLKLTQLGVWEGDTFSQDNFWINLGSGKLPTYPSPNPTFYPKREVSVIVSLGEGAKFLLPFVKMGTILASFQSLRKMPRRNDWLNNMDSFVTFL